VTPAIGITGTQHGPTVQQFAAAFAWVDRFRKRTDWLNHGDCIGVDADFAKWWANMGGQLRAFPPVVRDKRAWVPSDITEPAEPYLVRNRLIVDASSCMVAMPREEVEQERGGTWSTVRYARRVGVPCLLVLPSGVIVKESWR